MLLILLEVISKHECYFIFRQGDGLARWYKFDDGEVTECKMDDEEEMKTQCFGGDYMGEVCKFYSLKSPNKLDC